MFTDYLKIRKDYHSSNPTTTAVLQSPALSPEGLYAVSIHVHVLIKGQDGLTLAFHRLAQSEVNTLLAHSQDISI